MAVLLSVAGAAWAKPIPLSKPFEFQGKRIVVVAAMGHLAATSRTVERLLGMMISPQHFFTLPASVDLDSVVAREAAAELDSLGAQAQVVALTYRDDELYDLGRIESGSQLSSFDFDRRDAWASDLLRRHRADALLFVHSGQKYTSDYTPPVRHYGLFFTSPTEPVASYVHMVQALYVQDRKTALVTRGATGRSGAGDLRVAFGENEQPVLDDGQWEAASPSLELAAGRVARALVPDIQVRARNPRSSATESRRFAPPKREGVEFWFSG